MEPMIVARWEWRAFADLFPAIEAWLADWPLDQVRESEEIYLLSRRTDENTKVRYGLMDIKMLLEVDRTGLERWRPFLKFDFPLDAPMVRELTSHWEVAPPVGVAPCDLPTLLEQVVVPHPELAAVRVNKKRFGYTIDECFVERAELTFDGRPIQTVAVEHEEAERVVRVLQRWGVTPGENVNYVKALKRHLGWL